MKTRSKIKTGFSIGSLLLFSGLIMGSPLHSVAADKTAPLQRIMVAYSSISGNNAPLWVTQEKGFFKSMGWTSRQSSLSLEVRPPNL